MIFWLISLLFVGGTVFAVLFALRSGQTAASGNAHDAEVYRAQIHELDRDAARKLISPAEAEQARVEIGRRLIAADTALSQEHSDVATRSNLAPKIAAAAALLFIPALTLALYGYLGSPQSTDQPLHARQKTDPADLQVNELVARAESALINNPDDPRGWSVLAPIYIRLNRMDDAVNAYRNLVRIDDQSATHKIELAEALTLQAQNVVSSEAKELLTAAIAIAPTDSKARFYLALELTQSGQHKSAVASWISLIESSPPNAPWISVARTYLTASAKQGGIVLKPSTLGNPTAKDVEAAGAMSAEDRNAMISNMVAGLAEKLKSEPENVEGWLRLIRSYTVLNNPEKANATFGEAQSALKNNPSGLAKIVALAQQLKLITGDNQ